MVLDFYQNELIKEGFISGCKLCSEKAYYEIQQLGQELTEIGMEFDDEDIDNKKGFAIWDAQCTNCGGGRCYDLILSDKEYFRDKILRLKIDKLKAKK